MAISGIINTAIQQTPQNTQTDAVADQNKMGQGVGAVQPGTVPGTGSDPSYGAVLGSLGKFMPAMSGQMLEVVLLEITTKMKDLETASQKDKVKVDQESKRTALAEKHEKLKESEKKIMDAIEKEKHATIWDKIKMFFEALGAALMMLLGAVVAAVNPVAGALLIGVGVAMMIMVVDEIVKKETGCGIMGNIVKACGGSEEQIAKADMGFGISLAAVALIGSIAATALGGAGAASLVQIGTSIAGSAVAIATATGDTVTGVIKYEAAKTRAEGQKLQAEAKDMEAWIQQLDDFIDQSLQRLMGASDRFNNMLDGLMEAIQDKAKSVSRAHFTG